MPCLRVRCSAQSSLQVTEFCLGQLKRATLHSVVDIKGIGLRENVTGNHGCCMVLSIDYRGVPVNFPLI